LEGEERAPPMLSKSRAQVLNTRQGQATLHGSMASGPVLPPKKVQKEKDPQFIKCQRRQTQSVLLNLGAMTESGTKEPTSSAFDGHKDQLAGISELEKLSHDDTRKPHNAEKR